MNAAESALTKKLTQIMDALNETEVELEKTESRTEFCLVNRLFYSKQVDELTEALRVLRDAA